MKNYDNNFNPLKQPYQKRIIQKLSPIKRTYRSG